MVLFSHLFDKFSVSNAHFLRLVASDQLLAQYEPAFESLIAANKGRVGHEIISCAFIFKLIDELKRLAISDLQKFSPAANRSIENLSSERIVKLIEPHFEALAEFKVGNHNYTMFFSRIITAFPIDADRMDYLLRDSYFSGVTYGVYDINRIFASFIAHHNNGNIILAYKQSGLDSMLRFIQSRSHLYNQVYFHKTNRSANTMLAYGTAKGRERKVKVLDRCDSFDRLVEFYITNSDEFFLNYTVHDQISEDEIEKDVVQELFQRKLFKRVYEIKIVLTGEWKNKKERIEEIKGEIDRKLSDFKAGGRIYAISDMYENETYKDSKDKPIFIAKKGRKNIPV